MPLRIAILGRPNVGKSTLFNRLVGRRLALVDDTPGVTRDRREGDGSLGDLRFCVIDTAGLEEADGSPLAARMLAQTQRALDEADIVMFMIDARAGVTPLDRHFADWLRRAKQPVVLLANKAESRVGEQGAYEAFALGLGDPVPISAEHADGLGELYARIVDAAVSIGKDPHAAPPPSPPLAADGEMAADDDLDAPAEGGEAPVGEPEEGDLDFEFAEADAEDAASDEAPLQLAIIGRPNAGKSTLINHLVGEERVITGEEAGLTRDSIAIDWHDGGRAVRLFDTAGLRRRARVTEKLEKLSASDALRAIRFAQAVVLLVDAERGLDRQDVKLASLVADEGRAIVIALNKWDLVGDRLSVQRAVADSLQRSLPQLRGVSVVPISALTGQGVDRLMPAVHEAYELWNARIPTPAFNRWLAGTTDAHPPPAQDGRRTKIRYGAQMASRPPRFVLFTNHPKAITDSYLRYLENELRRDFKLPGVPIRFRVKTSVNPFGSRRKTKKQRLAERKTRRGR